VGHAKRILIVEDEAILGANLMTHFQRCGWDARIACNGKMAVLEADDFMPEVILLDYHLPDMNGFQALDAMRAGRQCGGCVLMTGHPTDMVIADARRHGIGHILTKPFSLAELESQLLATASEYRAKPFGGPDNK